ncbi:Ig-like domain repeat protein [Blautia stercoris]
MKNPKRNPVERFCALLLAFIMVFTLVLPDGALSVSAAGNNSDEASGEPEASTEKTTDVEFTIFEKVPTTENPDNKVAIQGADLQIKEAGTDNVVANGQSDANGKVKVENLTYDTEKSYEYTVSKAGYQSLENKSVSIGTVNEVEVTLGMSDISLGDLSAVELSPNKEGVPSQVQAVINNKIDNFEVGGAAQYKWESSNPAVADVDGNGLITAKGRGSATITVSRNGKSAQTTIKVKEVPSMELNVTPDNGTDVKSVTMTVTMPKDAKGGKVTFSLESGESYEVAVNEEGIAEQVLAKDLIGNVKVSAAYSGNELYFENSTEETGKYKQKKRISLTADGKSEASITYGSDLPVLSVENAEDRTVTFSSSKPNVVEATPDGVLTVKGTGRTDITATAAESDNYTESSASFTIKVNQKPINKKITFADFEWNVEKASKVYDGNDKIQMTGTLKNADVIDEVQVTVNAQLEKSDVGSYSKFTVTDADSDIKLKGANNYETTTDFSEKEVQLAKGKTVNITPRPVYVKAAVKEGKTTELSYGKTKKELQEFVEENYEVVLAGTKGCIDETQAQGLMGKDTIQLDEYAKVELDGFNDKEKVYYVGKYKVLPVVEKEDAGNYEIKVDTGNIGKYSANLTVKKETETQDNLKNLVDVVNADGIYQNEKDGSVYIRGNQSATLKLKFKKANAYYDQIWVSKGEKQQDGQEIYYDAINSGISFDDSEDKVYSLKVSLRNSKNAETVTDGEKYININVDATSPTADFADLGSAGQFNKVLPNDWKGFGNFSKDKEKAYLVTKSDNGSKVKSLKTCKVKIGSDDNNAIVAAISNAVKNDSLWVEEDTVKFAEEGNYIILALVEDNVGNKSVYASNGLVFDLTTPTVTITADSVDPKVGPDGTVNFQVKVNDTNVTSGIEKVEIIAMDSANKEVSAEEIENVKVSGGFDENSKKVTDSYTLNSEEINKIVGKEQDGTLESIQAHANFNIEGKLSINKYQSGYATVKVIVYDKAGNQSDSALKTVKVDVINPEIAVEYNIDSDNEYIQSSSRTMTITYIERNFIEEGLTFDVSIDGVVQNVSLKDIKEKTKERITASEVISKETDKYVCTLTFKGDGAYKVIPHITDVAGNENEGIIYKNQNSRANEIFILDKTAPEVNIKYNSDSDSQYIGNNTRTMTITYTERNFTKEGLTFDVSIDGVVQNVSLKDIKEKTKERITASEVISKETDKYVCTLTFKGDGAYKVIPHITDIVGNKNTKIEYDNTDSKANELFILDLTAPEVTVTYNDDELALHNGKYFNEQRTATISIKERNFDSGKLGFTLTRDGEEKTYNTFEELKKAVDGWDDCSITKNLEDNESDKKPETYTDDRTQTFTITFGKKGDDHDYKISVKVTDLAGNSNAGLTDKSAKVKTGDDFTVDMLAPKLDVKYYVSKDSEGKEVSSPIYITDSIGASEKSRFYKNATIFAEVTITEGNFVGESEFAKGQMILTYEAKDSQGIDVETKDFKKLANTKEEWKTKEKNNVQVFEFSTDANYTLGINYTDLAGNQAVEYETHYFTVDKTPPKGTVDMSDGDKKTETGSLLEKFKKLFFKLFSNKQIEAIMTGEDTTSPFVQKYYIDCNNQEYNKDDGSFKVKTEDELSKEEWTVYKDEKAIEENDYFSANSKTQSYSLIENSKAVPYLYLEDKAGNKTYMTSNGAIYDTENPTAPVITITTADPVAGVSDPGIEIFNSDVDFNISVEDPEVNGTYSGLASVSYEIKNNGKVTQEGNFNEDLKPVNMEKRLSRDLTVDASKNNGNNITIEVNAEDNAGNKSSARRELAIDKTKPEITVSYDNNDVANGKYFKANRTMTVSYKERNFYEKGITFDVSTNGGVLQEGISLEDLNKINGITVKFQKDSQSGRKLKELSDERVNTYTILFDAGSTNGDMDYSIVPHITDAAALVNENVEYGDSKAPEKFTIDKKAPVISMAYSAEGETINPGGNEVSRVYRNKTITATATIEERNFSNSNSFSEDPKQMNLTYEALNFQGSKVNTENYTGAANTRGEWSTNVYTRTKTFTFSQDANYTLGLVYRDLAGNEAVYDTRYFTVDKTAPTGSMTIEDNNGTAKTWIQWIQQVFFDIFTQSQKGVSMTSADETAGVASTQYYKYHPDSESRHTFDGLSTQNLDSISSWSDGYSTSVNADEQVIVYEKITDRAGNVTYINNQEGVIADNTSPTAPEIKITAAEPAQGIYNASVPFTIDVTDPENGGTYAGLKEVSYEITNNGKVTQSGNYNSDLSDPTARVHNIHRSETVNAELNNSNHVTIKVKAVDYAGNQSEATKDLKIDITHPEVTITFDLNNPLNGKYYKTTRTATISVKERNFDTNAVDLKITNTDGTMPSVSGWSISSQAGESDDAINTCRVEFSADGDYNMTMQCKDQAGNESNTVKVDEFTIDKTIPVISVSYDNNSAATPGYYNANRTATITIKEHNFNAAEVNSQITAALQGSGISAPGVGGWSNSGDTHTASVTFSDDGDYTFDIDYTDLAGNAAADYTQDSFTVDKTKPEVEFFDIEDKSANNGVVAPGVKYSDVNYLESGVEIKIEGAEHESKELTGSRSSIANGESIKMNDFEYTQDNDDVYTMTAVISDKAGNKTEKKIMFSVNRFGSNYSFSDTTKEFLDEVYSNSAKDLVITETNVDSLVFNGISYSLDNKTTELKQGTDYTVKETGGEGSWKQYTYTIKKENFEKEGRYSVTIDSEDKATNTMNNKVKERNINFVIDKTPPTVVITGIEESSYRADSRDMSVNVSDNTAVKRLDIMVDGKSVATYSQEDVKEAGGKIVYTLNSSNSKQKVKAVAVDMADNEATSDNHNILITTNLFIQYINNKPLFIGSIIALVLIAGGAIYFFVFRRKKSEDAADAN